ncbi:hypothetical protein ACIRP7_36760 [Streptomyces sp. NPDC102270]|uniref:hypothetical protein n=1 Tax=Streptomyces sp. NPDC102270 TaxID=3366150 RepID=UPI00381706E4
MTVSNVVNDHPNVRRATREPATCARAGPASSVSPFRGSTVRTTASWLPPSSPRPCGTTCG